MELSGIISVIYFIIGFALSIYWFNKDYAKSYNAAVAEGDVEKGMSSIFLVVLMLFWPIKLVKNIIKRHRI